MGKKGRKHTSLQTMSISVFWEDSNPLMKKTLPSSFFFFFKPAINKLEKWDTEHIYQLFVQKSLAPSLVHYPSSTKKKKRTELGITTYFLKKTLGIRSISTLILKAGQINFYKVIQQIQTRQSTLETWIVATNERHRI